MKYLWDKWPDSLKNSGLPRKPLVIFLDYDGTLAPIARHHHAAVLYAGMRDVLKRLAAVHRLVIISGRMLADVRARCGLTGIIYVGNHGLQTAGFKQLRSAGQAAAMRQARCIPILTHKLTAAFYGFPQVLIEDKVYTITIHYRNLHPSRRAAFNAMIKLCREELKKYPVVWRKGKKVWEIRPKQNWGKGDAVRMIKNRFSSSYPVVIGDDDTDEDMFRVIGRSGLTIRVGRRSGSNAAYYLRSPREVKAFLELLAIPGN